MFTHCDGNNEPFIRPADGWISRIIIYTDTRIRLLASMG
jgi:hypothetical protein